MNLEHLVKQLKRCETCQKDLPMDQFYKHASTKDGRFPDCRHCFATAQRRKYAAKKGGVVRAYRRKGQT